MADSKELVEAIKLYEAQLEKVNAAILAGPKGEELEQLHSLRDNINELLHLTQESLDSLEKAVKNPAPDTEDDDPFAKEYALFKNELASLDPETSSSNDKLESVEGPEVETVDIQEELDELVGSKCQAPYTNKLAVTDYFNALVYSVDVPESATDSQDIQVKVMFINPVEKEMVPCPFYLDGNCKFSDGKCNYSHGYLVPFTGLREYKEPDFSLIKRGCHVLVKPKGGQLWVPSRIEQVLSDDVCLVKLRGGSVQVEIHDIFPLTSSSDQDLSDDEEEDIRILSDSGYNEAAVEHSLTNAPMDSKLGAWEEHTKGIGSKLMAKMGYVVGSGLGKQGEGRVEPVQATVLPPGKSLDHCMQLREAAGGSKDLFSAEKIQRKLAIRAQKRSMKLYKKQQEEEKHNVFNIINDTLSSANKKPNPDGLSSSFRQKLVSSTNRELNVEKLKVEETIKQMKQDVYILNDKLSMKKEGSIEYKNIAAKLYAARHKLENLEKKDGKIAWEINTRETKKKMIF